MQELNKPTNPLYWNNIPVMTTDMLASLLGTNSDVIKKNFSRNKEYYTPGEHFILLEGADLKKFKNDYVTNGHVVENRARHLYLWTEQGSMNHVKSTQSNEAWETFQRTIHQFMQQRAALAAIAGMGKTLQPHTEKPVQIENSKKVNTFMFKRGKIKAIRDYHKKITRALANGMDPSEVIAWAKGRKMHWSQRTSAREVFRNTRPQIACAMSLADTLCQDGVPVDEAIQAGEQSKPIFALMIKYGITPPELNA